MKYGLKFFTAFFMVALLSVSLNAIVHKLPPLPYPEDALSPMISKETVFYHYEKHHAKYVENLNNLIKGTKFEDMSLEDTARIAGLNQTHTKIIAFRARQRLMKLQAPT